MKIIECEQGSPEWFQARCGVPSASSFDKIVDISGNPSKQRKKYLYQLAGEIITGKQEETYQNSAMLRGKELEAEARSLYELTSGASVKQVGFCLGDGYGCSPDGLIGEDGGVEIKCPMMATHVGYLLNGELPSDYFQQVQGSILITGRKWWDFVSYYPAMKPLIVRVNPDKKFLEKLESELGIFTNELKEIAEKIGG